MKFTLKNVINNLIRVFNSIKTSPDDDIDKKYQRLNEMLLDYLHRDIVSSKKYFSLLEIEYFLLTNFIDIKEEEFDIEALRAIFDNFCDDIDSVEWYFFDDKHMLMIIEEILKNLEAGRNTFIHFDIDAMDYPLSKGTGSPMLGGFTYDEATEMLEAIANHCNVVGMAMTEVAPQYDDEGDTTCYTAARLTCDLMGFATKAREK